MDFVLKNMAGWGLLGAMQKTNWYFSRNLILLF